MELSEQDILIFLSSSLIDQIYKTIFIMPHRLFILVFYLFFNFILTFEGIAQNVPSEYEMQNFKLTNEMKKWIKIKKKKCEGIKPDSVMKNYQSFLYALASIDTSRSEFHFNLGLCRVPYHLEKVIPELIKRITDTTYVEIESTFYYIIKERPDTYNGYDGRGVTLDYYNKHLRLIEDDIFKIGGRANFILKSISGKNFGTIKVNSAIEELQEIQGRWIKWLRGLLER